MNKIILYLGLFLMGTAPVQLSWANENDSSVGRLAATAYADEFEDIAPSPDAPRSLDKSVTDNNPQYQAFVANAPHKYESIITFVMMLLGIGLTILATCLMLGRM